jgi:hypothetical protein
MANSFLTKYKTVYVVWTGICLCSLALAPWLDTVNPGGRQVGMTFLAGFIPVALIVYGLLASIFLFLPGPKSAGYVWGNRLILVGVLGVFGSYWLSMLDDVDTVTKIRNVDHTEIKTELEYYRYFPSLKAIRHYRNLYNDSIWVEYNRLGKLTKRIIYTK